MDITIAGDFSPMNRVADMLEHDGFPISFITDVRGKDDLFVLNFESSIPTKASKKISKLGPHLNCSDKVVNYLKKAGVTAVTLANNHTLDYGADGLKNTIKQFTEKGIKTVGGGENIEEASKILYLRKETESVAIINCCEHEFSCAINNNAGTNPLEPIKQFYSIKEAKRNADYVVVIVHGGHEYYNLPSSRMQETYRFFIEAGADAVINHHQHCFSGYETFNGKPIFYGLGNFCFDWPGKKPSFYTGYCVRLHLNKNVSFEVIPYKQCADEPIIDVGEFDGFNETLVGLNSIICNPICLKENVECYYKTMNKSCENVLSPFSNDYINEIISRGYLPKLITKGKKLQWKAYIDCESHRDVMLYYLMNNF